ncbi:MAG: DUF559 domain-containing protein [Rickettsiales bacterium]|nr:DUF559 domain-containing protein [Rickettsiales bacterium]
MILIINTSSTGIDLALGAHDIQPPTGAQDGTPTPTQGGSLQLHHPVGVNVTRAVPHLHKHQNISARIRNFAQHMRRNMTLAEKKFWYAVNNKKLGFKFCKQYPVDDKYIADFVCLEKKLIVEIDGALHYENKNDKIRTEYLQKFGFNVVRFWNWDINENLNGCLNIIGDILTNNSFEKRLEEFHKNINYLKLDKNNNVVLPATQLPPRGGVAERRSRDAVGGLPASICKHIETAKQSLELPGAVESFLRENNCWFTTIPAGDTSFATSSPAKGISAVGVVVGPGSFTGIRLGIAYTKGLGIGLNIPVVPVNAFEIYLAATPDAFVAIDSGRGDLFVAAHDIAPCTMEIDAVETKQMEYQRTVGHKPFDLADALAIVARKLESENSEPAVPMYLRPSYAEINNDKKSN